MYKKIEKVFDRFQDNESRQLFLLKLQTGLYGGGYPHDYLKAFSNTDGGGGGYFWQ
jgi:hypothetical protein